MAVHMLRVTVAPVDPNGDPVDLQAKKDTVQNWVYNHQEVLVLESESFSTGSLDGVDPVTEFARGSWRFHWDEDPVSMKDEITSWLDSNFQWWVVAYHQCDHDEPDAADCGWDEEFTSSTTPPDAVTELS